MTNFTRTFLFVIALIVGALLLACSSDSDSGDGNGDQPSGEAATELRNLAAQFGQQEIKIEYQFTSGAAGGIDDVTMTLYWKPPDAQRTDLSTSEGDVTLITTAGGSYICASAVNQCLESPIGDSLTPDFFDIFTEPDILIDQIDAVLGDLNVDRSNRTIAGQDATCFSISGTIDGETGAVEYCFRDDGVLLLLRAAGGPADGDGGESSLEAISVEDSVSDSDLEPPYDVLDVGDIQDLLP